MSTAEVEGLKSQVNIIDDKVDRILSYLDNDEKTGRIGLVTQIKHHEINVQALTLKIVEMEHQKSIDKAVSNTKMAVWGSIGGGIMLFATWLFKILLPFFLSKI